MKDKQTQELSKAGYPIGGRPKKSLDVKLANINLSLPITKKNFIKKAAECRSMSMTAFLMSNAIEVAEKILNEAYAEYHEREKHFIILGDK